MVWLIAIAEYLTQHPGIVAALVFFLPPILIGTIVWAVLGRMSKALNE
jgi:hypothetical protein